MGVKKYKVLILAEAANPEWTSVPLIGWSYTEAIGRVCDIHLVTQIRNKEAIERHGWTEGREFTALNTEFIAKPINILSRIIRGGDKLAWTVATAFQSFIYPYFEYKCWKTFSHRLKSGEFDVVHRVTPVSPTAPSYLAKKLKSIGVPFVVGPMNGGVDWPVQFSDRKKQEKEWLTKFRQAYKFLPGYKSMRKTSSAILAGSRAVQQQLPEYTNKQVLYMPENGIDTQRFELGIRKSHVKHPLRAAFIGRLVPYKGVDMAINAIEHAALKGEIYYDIFGAGPEMSKLRGQIESLGLEKSITLHGNVQHSELTAYLKDIDVLIFPSIREFGGGVILEAMACGIVPIVVDYAGPSELVDDSCGYLIELGNQQEIEARLKVLINRIIDNPDDLSEKSKHGILKVKEKFTWSSKAENTLRIYSWVLGESDKPELPY
ncbi:glycosyltransferase family 4 protein [uncultured Microbulbifer sp.]|uniref:glycosyltransferase family 4 protein n=1 Tax=uncultured Microbulbifer sp. TaxID=348147 RepID=UPI00262BDCA4|nr:glycosyltransferase family 4 protein [uncultured Microbulbifer sp.]